MNNHTPGPWNVEVGDESSDYAHQFPIIMAKDYEVVGVEGFYSGDLKTDIANATLAASSPELLEALQIVCEQFGGRVDFPYDKVRSVIEKATGCAQ